MIKRIIYLVIAILLLSITTLVLLIYQKINQPLSIKKPELITLVSGSSINRFSHQLVKNTWLDNRFWLRNYVRINPEYAQIKKGTYQLTVGMTVLELLEMVKDGKEHQFTITFIEGSTFKEWRQQLAENPFLTQSIADQTNDVLMAKITSDYTMPEGLFFPDTYAFTHGTLDTTLLKRAYQRMTIKLQQHWQNRQFGLPLNTAYDALILASIIEKESGDASEYQTIASVFVNRLNKKMRLQTDPTVIYGLGDEYQGDIKRVHLKQYTPYNTYRIKGLPPTPIAMPGENAIIASLNPIATDYLYFVSNGKGQHVFSTNLADHNRALRRYLESLK